MIEDWDDAFANGAYIVGADEYPEKWAELAGRFRQMMTARGLADLDIAYGDSERQKLDIFRPQYVVADGRVNEGTVSENTVTESTGIEGTYIEGTNTSGTLSDGTDTEVTDTVGSIKGLVVFVHGGYWRAFDKAYWSHLARGSIARGWAVAIPSYDLVPTVSITDITRQIAAAIDTAAAIIGGPLRLSGHSAGGHLVSRMICEDSPLMPETRRRVGRVVSISGLHDLRPLLQTRMNDDFRLDLSEAAGESAALKQPLEHSEIVCWVGADERPEFIRQSELLANIWTGFGIRTSLHRVAGQHHFNVIDGLAEPNSPLVDALLG